MRFRAAVTAAVVVIVGLAWFGRSAWGGHFLVDDSPSMDIYHLSTLYERWAHYLRRGEFPSWMPEFAAGYPAPASWMYGLYYPGLLLFAFVPAGAAWTWTAVLHMVLGAVGVHRLARAETDDDVAALTAGVVFAVSELMIGRTLYGHLNVLCPIAWSPWVFVHLRGVARGRRGALPWLIAVTTLGLLSGHVQVWFYVVPAALAYAAVQAAGVADRGRLAGRLALAGAVVVCLTAVQWLPTLELARIAQRAAPTASDVADFCTPAHVLAAKLFPGALGYPPDTDWGPSTAEHEFGALGGLLLVVLAAPALLRFRGGDRLWAGVAVAGLVLAQGIHNPLSELLNAIPPVRWGRTPARALLLTTLAVAVLSGRGFAEWRRIARESPDTLRKTTLRAGALTLAFAVAGAATLFVGLRNEGLAEHTDLVVRAVVTSAVLAAAVLVLPLVARGEPRAWYAVPALAIVGVILGGAPPARSIRADFYATDWASMLPESITAHRLHLLSGRMPNVERQGLRTLREICYVDARWFSEYMEDAAPPRASWLDVAVEVEGIPRERVLTGVLGPDDLIGRPYEAFGPGVVLDGALVEPDDARVLAAIDRGERALYLAAPTDGASGTTSQPVAGARVTRGVNESPESVALEVDSPLPGWLLVSEKHYPGWTATVNGVPAEIHRANVMFRAVRVPQGHTNVVMTYEPWTVRVGAILFAVGLVGGLVLLAAGRRGT